MGEALLENPADERSLEDWAPQVGASARTLARLFVSETGLTFAEWRRQVRLLEAIDRLGKGQAVTRVALDLGYESPSAFIAMFRRTLGAPLRGLLGMGLCWPVLSWLRAPDAYALLLAAVSADSELACMGKCAVAGYLAQASRRGGQAQPACSCQSFRKLACSTSCGTQENADRQALWQSSRLFGGASRQAGLPSSALALAMLTG